jgi:hypothetical protein
VTCNAVLKEQMVREITEMLPNESNIQCYSSLGLVRLMPDICLIDEADECLNNLVGFDSKTLELIGVITCGSAKFLGMFSATQTARDEKIVSAAFDIEGNKVVYFSYKS